MIDYIQPERPNFYGWKNAVLLFFVYSIMMGFIFYGFSVIFPAMIKAQGWGRGEASLAHSLRGLIVGFIAPLVALSLGKIGARKTMQIGFCIGAIALILLGTITKHLWQWTVLWGVVMPFAFGLSSLIPIQTTVNFWFTLRRAAAIGLVMTGGAVAGFISAPLCTSVISKSGTWQTGWIAGSGLCIVGIVLTFYIQNKPEDIGQHPDGIDPTSEEEPGGVGRLKKSGAYKTKEVWTLKEALRTRVVWLQLLCMIGQAWALYLITVHGVLHLTDKGFSRMEAASVLGNLILFSGIARFPMGVLADRIEPRILTSLAFGGMAVTLYFLWRPPLDNIFLLIVIAAAYGFFFGTTVIMFPMLTANYFGPSVFAPINGFFSPIIIVVCAPLPYVAGWVFDLYKSYNMIFIPVIAWVACAAILACFLYPPAKTASA